MNRVDISLPDALHTTAQELARREAISLSELITLALSEKVSALMTDDYINRRAARADRQAYLRALDQAPDTTPMPEDRLSP